MPARPSAVGFPHGDRSRYWPAIEKTHGEPMQYWFDQVRDVPGGKYADQIARLRVQKKTVRVPLDWQVDDALLRDMIAARVAQLATPS